MGGTRARRGAHGFQGKEHEYEYMMMVMMIMWRRARGSVERVWQLKEGFPFTRKSILSSSHSFGLQSTTQKPLFPRGWDTLWLVAKKKSRKSKFLYKENKLLIILIVNKIIKIISLIEKIRNCVARVA